MSVLKVLVYSGFFIGLGIFVWRKQTLDFIAGYEQHKFYKPKQLARNTGLILILFGIEVALLMILQLFGWVINGEVIGVLAIIHCIAILLCFLYDIQKSKG